jgi:hypothetical protein
MLTRSPARQRRRKKRLTLAERAHLDKLAADKKAYRDLIENGGALLRGLQVRDVNALTEALLDLRWLKECQSEDRKALLDDIAKPYRRPMS